MKASSSTGKTTTLQEILLSSEPEQRGLYWRHVAHSPGRDDHATAVSVLRPGETFRLDTFLNCFYERYWRELTSLTTFGVEIVVSGPCSIRLLRSGHIGPPRVLQEATSSGERSITALSAASDSEGGGILHVEIHALSDRVEVHAGRWTTIESPVNRVALAIVICSFGRENMVAATLERMAEIVERSAAIGNVLVVHQGSTDLGEHASIRDMRARDLFGGKLKIVRQRNHGGSGGFARGMIEAMGCDVTDILLMDDDIRLEPAVISRLTNLLAYVKAPTTIGGQMLVLHDPVRLHASHERVDFGKMQLVNPYNDVDLSMPRCTELFNDVQASGYSAWWFCSIPTAVIRDVGLPLPVFLSFDDIEHGVRTVASGRPLVTMPGLFVWHMAFGSKGKPWQVYYDRRNILICAALHARTSTFRPATRFAREAWIGLALGRYDYCHAVCRAVEDYLEGPDVVFSDSASHHQTVLADMGSHMLHALKEIRLDAKVPTRDGTEASWTMARLTFSLLRSLARRGPSAALRRRLALSIAKMAVRLWLGGGRARRAYRASAHKYTTVAFWEGRLGLRPRSTSS